MILKSSETIGMLPAGDDVSAIPVFLEKLLLLNEAYHTGRGMVASGLCSPEHGRNGLRPERRWYSASGPWAAHCVSPGPLCLFTSALLTGCCI